MSVFQYVKKSVSKLFSQLLLRKQAMHRLVILADSSEHLTIFTRKSYSFDGAFKLFVIFHTLIYLYQRIAT